MENKDTGSKVGKVQRNIFRKEIYDFCKEEIARQVEHEVANKVVVTLANEELEEPSLNDKLVGYMMRIGATYGFAVLIFHLYCVVMFFMNAKQF